MSKKITIIMLFFLITLLFSQVKAADEKNFKIMTESESGDYIGQNDSWNFSNADNYVITVTGVDEDSVVFHVEDSSESSLRTFEFASETGKIISKGLYTQAERFAFRDSYNGISISGEGRACNEILGAFYVHEYVLNNETLEKAAIDFVQICEPSSDDINSDSSPKLYGSLRYGSSVPDSCDIQGCAEAKKNLGITDIQESTSNQDTNNISNTANNTSIITSASELPKADAHKAIVKIESFSLNQYNELAGYSSGSGVIIDSSGIVLTNYHVVTLEDDFDNSIKESAYIICLTEDISQEPDCSYIGKLMGSDKDLDTAVLKIENISGYSNKNTFPFLNLNTIDSTEINDQVTALGYPAIGGDTITITQGVISGKESKYSKEWLKTDAVISYGSSGGAAIDADGNIIGITSESHSDLLGALGYIVNVISINDWINTNKVKAGITNSITNRASALAKKIINLKNSNNFVNASPGYSLTKPSDWNFNYGEAFLGIHKESDDEGGTVFITTAKFPYIVDTDIVAGSIKRTLNMVNLLSITTIVKNEDLTIGGKKAKKLILSTFGAQSNYYYIPVNNYLLGIFYDYGNNDKDKSIIDSIINSISISDANQYTEVIDYSNDNPKFSISTNDNWVLLQENSKTNPLVITNKNIKDAFADIKVRKTDDNTKNLNNDEYLSLQLQSVKDFNNLINTYDIKMEVLESNAHYKLNNELRDVVMMDYIKKSIASGQIFSQNRVYYIKSGDKYICPSLNYFSDNTNNFNDVRSKFNNMLSSFSLNTSQALKVNNISMYNNLKGKIMLKVESKGEAYYIHPSSQKMYYLGLPDDAFSIMREQGIGITASNLEKIPVGLGNLTGLDSDGDGLPDLFEDAIGTNKNDIDSDGDGFNDKTELEGNYNPKGSGKLYYDKNFTNGQKGKIFLQVENNGEAWYINPDDSKRYFLGRPADAFNVMRNLGLGISNNDFNRIK